MFLGEVGRGGRGKVDGGRKRLSQSSLLIQKGERNATAQTLLSQKIIFFLNLEDLGFLEKKINFFLFLPRVTNVAALNGSMDGKCNGCIILK